MCDIAWWLYAMAHRLDTEPTSNFEFFKKSIGVPSLGVEKLSDALDSLEIQVALVSSEQQ